MSAEKTARATPHGDLSWDEAACRARLACREKLAEVSPMAFVMPVWSDLRAAMAALDAVRIKCERLRGALAEVALLRARLEECRLIGAGESDAVAESLKLRSERDHWHRAWAGCRGEIDRLRAVLRPFALQAAVWHADWPDDTDLNEDHDHPRVTVGDCRRAAEVLEGGF